MKIKTLKEWYDSNKCGFCDADLTNDPNVHIIDGVSYCGNCWADAEEASMERNNNYDKIPTSNYFGDNVFEESLVLKDDKLLKSEAVGLKIENPRVEKELVKMKVNGKEYAYKHNTMSAQELLDKYNSIKKHSEGKAYAWLRAHSVLVKKESIDNNLRIVISNAKEMSLKERKTKYIHEDMTDGSYKISDNRTEPNEIDTGYVLVGIVKYNNGKVAYSEVKRDVKNLMKNLSDNENRPVFYKNDNGKNKQYLSMKESKRLQERQWKLLLDSSVRKALENEDIKEVINCLKKYNETIQNSDLSDLAKESFQEYFDENELEMDDILNDQLFDEDDIETTIDYLLSDFYDLCDATEVFIKLSESKKMLKENDYEYPSDSFIVDAVSVEIGTINKNLREIKRLLRICPENGMSLQLYLKDPINELIMSAKQIKADVYGPNINESKKTLKENNEGNNVEIYHFNNRLNEVQDMIEKAYNIGNNVLIENFLMKIKTMLEKYQK